ncbi:MAG TPA: hypothetical protein DD766_08240 [Desulfovibrio sp.]|nr:hypothetical protein [Desulfovibrio sp.]
MRVFWYSRMASSRLPAHSRTWAYFRRICASSGRAARSVSYSAMDSLNLPSQPRTSASRKRTA